MRDLVSTIDGIRQLIADLFSRIHFGEKLGSGMQRMKEFCKADNAPSPKIEFTDTHLYIIFKQSDEYLKKVGEKPGVKKRLESTEKIRRRLSWL